jgi:DNA polymerase family A
MRRGELVGLVVLGDGTLAIAVAGDTRVSVDATAVADIDATVRPRWAVWSNETAAALLLAGVRLSTCWDVAAVHRLVAGSWRADPGRVWAALHGLDEASIPVERPPDLFSVPSEGDAEEPIGVDGHIRAEWAAGSWASSNVRAGRWADLAMVAARLQSERTAELGDRVAATARAESTAELLCAELAGDGLPLDRSTAEQIIATSVGPRPRSDADAAAQRARRDGDVLRHAPLGAGTDLRNPAHVRSLLRQVGVEVPDTRAWRLEAVRGAHPLVEALLTWRKAERIATTFGYSWLDEHVGDDGRLRGAWTGSDGAAGRMTASAGLHNMPAEMRAAVIAEAGHVFVRADLGQIEPRVLAAVSGDAVLARATESDDLYAPVADDLGVDRATAKVAVLGAMYGQTTGHGAAALRRLRAAYPVAMAYLDDADVAGQAARDVRTYGGRLVRMGSPSIGELGDRDARSRAAARGRYARNAVVQGAAAELFKVWAVTVRARLADVSPSGRIVLCLHDELLVHVPDGDAAAVARLVDDCLAEAAHRWAPTDAVRFVAETVVVRCWAEAP